MEISRTDSKLGIETTTGKLEMKRTDPKVELRQKNAKINIETEPIRVTIDQSESFASAGLKGYEQLTRENAQLGRQKLMEYIAKVASNGDMMADIKSGGDPIAMIGAQAFNSQKTFDFGLIPTVRPKIEVTGSLQIDPEPFMEGTRNGVQINVVDGKTDIKYSPAQVRIFVEQYASINYKYLPDKKIDVTL